jgi:tetratricopeptide (TPR) repeat protein
MTMSSTEATEASFMEATHAFLLSGGHNSRESAVLLSSLCEEPLFVDIKPTSVKFRQWIERHPTKFVLHQQGSVALQIYALPHVAISGAVTGSVGQLAAVAAPCDDEQQADAVACFSPHTGFCTAAPAVAFSAPAFDFGTSMFSSGAAEFGAGGSTERDGAADSLSACGGLSSSHSAQTPDLSLVPNINTAAMISSQSSTVSPNTCTSVTSFSLPSAAPAFIPSGSAAAVSDSLSFNFGTDEEVAHPDLPLQLLQCIKMSDPALTNLEIRNKSNFKERDCRELARALSLNTCITSLDLWGTIVSPSGACLIFSALAQLTALTVLNLNESGVDSSRASHLCSALTHLTAMTGLFLKRNKLTANDGARICSAAAAAGMTSLKTLELSGNYFSSAFKVTGCEAWKQLHLLQPPDDFIAVVPVANLIALVQYLMSSNRAEFSDAYHPNLPLQLLQRVKASDPTLTDLNLSFKMKSFFEGGCRVLARALSLNTCITSLNLESTGVGGDGAAVLFPALTHLTALTFLNLKCSGILSSGAFHLCSAFTHLTAMTELSLYLNDSLTANDGARICAAAAAAGMTRLRTLELGRCGFSVSRVVECEAWRQMNLPQPPSEIVRKCEESAQFFGLNFSPIVSYLLGEDEVSCHAVRSFVATNPHPFEQHMSLVEAGGQVLDLLCDLESTANASKKVSRAVELIYRGADVSVSNAKGDVLMNATSANLTELVAAIIGRIMCTGFSANLNDQNSSGYSALMCAADGGHSDIAALLLASGADAFLTDNQGSTAADRARKNGHSAIADMIENPHNEAVISASLQVSIYRMFALCHLTDVFDVLSHGTWLQGLDAAALNGTALFHGHPSKPLSVAIMERNELMVEMICSHPNADPGASLYNGYFGVESNCISCLLFSMLVRKTPDFHHLVVQGIFQRLVVVCGVDVNAKIKVKPNSHLSGFILEFKGIAEISPLALTLCFFEAPYFEKLAASDAILILELLIDAGADVNETIVQYQNGEVKEIRLICWFCNLLFRHIKLRYRDAERASIEHRPLRFRPLKKDLPVNVVAVFQMLVAAGAVLNAPSKLENILETSIIHCVLAIASEAFDPKKSADKYHKRFFEAWQEAMIEIIRLAMQAGEGSDGIFVKSNGFEMPFVLFYVFKSEGCDFCRFLLNAGLNINAKCRNAASGEEITPLFLVTAYPDFRHDLFQMLIEAGADINETFSCQQQRISQCSLLSFAVMTGKVELARILIAANADVNLISRATSSSDRVRRGGIVSFPPLKLAVQIGNETMTQLLIDSRADVNASINYFDGFESICHFAVESGKSEILRMLTRAGCNVNCVSKFPGLQETPLGVAIRKCDVDMVIVLLENNAEFNHVLSIEVGSYMDYNALECVQKMLEELKSAEQERKKKKNFEDAADRDMKASEQKQSKCLIKIRSILQQHGGQFKSVSVADVYNIEVKSAHGDGTFKINFEIDDSADCTVLELKKRIQQYAMHKCCEEFLVLPSRLRLVHNGRTVQDHSKVSDVFLLRVKSYVTVQVIEHSKNDVVLDDGSLDGIEESRQYVTVQKHLHEVLKQISEAKRIGDDLEIMNLEACFRQIQFDNPPPSSILQDRHLFFAIGNRSIQAHIQNKFERGLLEEARQLQLKVIERDKMGNNIPELTRSLMKLSEILRAQGKLDEAKSACADSLGMLKQFYGEDHPNTLEGMGFYAGILIEMRSIDEAEQLLASWLTASQQLLGDKHQYTIACSHALQYFRRAHEIIRNYPCQRSLQQSTSEVSGRESDGLSQDGCNATCITELVITQLCDSKFERLHVLQCLVAANSNLEVAKTYLENGLPETLQSQFVYGHLISKMWTHYCLKCRSSSQAPHFDETHIASAAPSPNFNRSTQWLCEQGTVRPKYVDYSSYCPKGSKLFSSQQLNQGCFLCGRSSPVSGYKCSECCSYGVCATCVQKLSHSHCPSTPNQDFPNHGVKISFLKAFKNRWGSVYAGWSTSQVVKMIVKPLTCLSKQSVCDDLIAAESSEVGIATVFVSHVWAQSFSDTLDAFLDVAESWESGSKDDAFVWMDVFSANQHAAPDELPARWWMAAFKQAISRMGRLVMIMQPWDKPVALTRGWCILEVFSCVSNGGRFEVALPPSERARFFNCDASSRANFFKNLPHLMNSRCAQFSREEDKTQILGDIASSVGFSAIDATLLQAVEAWYVPQFQLIAAAASAFFDCGEMQADVFFQLAYLHYLRGNYSAALIAGERTLELLRSIKSFSSSWKALMNQRRISIQTRLLVMNSLHMQGNFSEVRYHHFILMHSLRPFEGKSWQEPSPYDADFYSTQNDQLRQKYFEYLKQVKDEKIELRGSYLSHADDMMKHATYPYCALGIPAEITAADDTSLAWQASHGLRAAQTFAIISAAEALLESDSFLKSVAFQMLLSSSGRFGSSRSGQCFHQYQDIAGPVATVMRLIWPHHESSKTVADVMEVLRLAREKRPKEAVLSPEELIKGSSAENFNKNGKPYDEDVMMKLREWEIVVFTKMASDCPRKWNAEACEEFSSQLKNLFFAIQNTSQRNYAASRSGPSDGLRQIGSDDSQIGNLNDLNDFFDENDELINYFHLFYYLSWSIIFEAIIYIIIFIIIIFIIIYIIKSSITMFSNLF